MPLHVLLTWIPIWDQKWNYMDHCLEPITFYADSDPGFALKKKDQDPEHEHFFKIYWLFFLHLRSFFAF